jgi:hypothetical protein
MSTGHIKTLLERIAAFELNEIDATCNMGIRQANTAMNMITFITMSNILLFRLVSIII